ncbi:MAG TPA: hypothetical protein VNA04_07995 [Thermoanaerobaculia bacterium]|nr:hypothetical protein [Thermoanaerobaculia bacterium]
MRLPIVIAALAAALTGTFAAAETRSYAGGLSTRWNTVGWHGHDQPLCPAAAEEGAPPSKCNDLDYLQANLDNSIGFRFGRERDSFEHGPLTFTLGAEAAFVDSEYNLSQDHLTFFAAAAVAGVDYPLFLGARIGARYGAGPFVTSDGRWGAQGFAELAGTFPLRSGAALRIAHRNVSHLFRYDGAEPRFGGLESARRGETSILLVAAPHAGGASRWEFSATAGVSAPGAGYGEALGLRRAAWQRLAAMVAMPSRDLQVQLSWTAAAHESTEQSTFLGFSGNERGKTIDAVGIVMRHRRPLTALTSLHYGAGVEVADFSDEHRLLTRNGEEVRGGVEHGLTAGASLRMAVAPHAALEGGLEHVYWRGIGLGELRWGVGLVITR